MSFRKNKKRIDPRYFLHEQEEQEKAGKSAVTTSLAHLASAVMCENPKLADWGHHFSQIRQYAGEEEGGDMKRILGLLKELENSAAKGNWDFARQALMHLSNYYKKIGLLDGDAYNSKASDLCPEKDRQ
jgi:hypothetical protein